MTERSDLDPLFDPASIAVVGASPDASYSSRLINNLLDCGYSRPLHLVNPGRDEAWGRPCYDQLRDVPEVVDLVVVSIPREPAVDVVRDAATIGVPAALVITAGFSEADDRGRTLEEELEAIAVESGIRICGPNCIGIGNMRAGIMPTCSCTREPRPGSIGLVSQSGALSFTTFYERATDEDIRFAYIVSTGNEADQSLTDYVEYMAADPEVDVICTYIEGLVEPRRFARVAAEATLSGTPILTVKVGRSDDVDVATMSHTGSVTGDDQIWDAVFEQTGIQRISEITDLLYFANVHAHYDPPEDNNLCVISTSGGLASLLADYARDRGLGIPALSPGTESALREIDDLLTFGEFNNPADVRGYGAGVITDIADIVFSDDQFDAYVIASSLSTVDDKADQFAEDMIEMAGAATKPVVVLWTGRQKPAELPNPQPLERLQRHVPVFDEPERCIDAIASLVEFGEMSSCVEDLSSSVSVSGSSKRLAEFPSDIILTWEEAERLLDEYDLKPVRSKRVTDPEDAVSVAESIGYPVVLKVDSRDIAHRKEIGGLALDLRSPSAVREAYTTIRENVKAVVPEATIHGVLVQPQRPAETEVFIGAVRDDDFGPIVTVGAGGSMIESSEDRVIRLAPIGPKAAHAAIAETRIANGLRDRELETLSTMLSQVSEMIDCEERLAELDLNPIRVADGECSIIDMLAKTSGQ